MDCAFYLHDLSERLLRFVYIQLMHDISRVQIIFRYQVINLGHKKQSEKRHHILAA